MSKSSDLAALKSAFQKAHKLSLDAAANVADLCYKFFEDAVNKKRTLVEFKDNGADSLKKNGSFAPLVEKIARGCNVGYIEADGKTVRVFAIEKK